MPYRVTQCYPPPDRGDIPALTPAEAGTRLSDPGGMQGWDDLVQLDVRGRYLAVNVWRWQSGNVAVARRAPPYPTRFTQVRRSIVAVRRTADIAETAPTSTKIASKFRENWTKRSSPIYDIVGRVYEMEWMMCGGLMTGPRWTVRRGICIPPIDVTRLGIWDE